MAKGKGGFIGQDGLNAPDAPTGVSGTAGDTQVTVSFTAPSDVGGSAITGYNVVASDGSNASPYFSGTTYSNKSFTPSPTINSLGVAFKTDGTKMYTLDLTGDDVAQYSLTSAWDVSTATSDSKTFDVGSQDTDPYEVAFKSDGTKMYILGTANDTLYQYSLSTAWDVSTASYDSVSFSFTSQTLQPYGMSFSPNGTKLYVADQQNSKILQYTLSTAWDASTISYASKFLDVSGEQGNSIYGVAISYDGSYIYSGTQSTGVVYQYKLSTAFDVSTGSYTNVSVSTSSQEAAPTSIEFDTSGKSMFITGFNTDTVYQYTIPDYPTASPVTVTGLTNGTSYTFNVWAINAFGWSVASDASGAVSPVSTADRGLFGGGYTSSNQNVIDFVLISSTANATDFGDLTVAREGLSAFSSSTRGAWAGGYTSSNSNVIDYVTIASVGNATDFGDLAVGNQFPVGLSNSTRGVVGGGYESNYSNRIQYVTIASTGNSSDFGDLTRSNAGIGACASTTRGVFAAGGDTRTNIIDYITIASTGNATDFGDYSADVAYPAGCSSSTIGIFGGGNISGNVSINTINQITIASTGNTTDFGDLTVARHTLSACSNSTRGLFAGGMSPNSTVIDYVTIASAGNASDFGDLTLARKGLAACSGSHGGLS
jgi:6-phosphogluconolactonase (cycloisomerase 2 family)